MSARQFRKQGFTLVEILIVVVILGILAAIVIPQFTNASESAKASSLISQLQTIRSQLELYQVQHGGMYPQTTTLPDGAATFWDQMTLISDSSGKCYASVDDVPAGTITYGPYLQQAPVNSLANKSLKTTAERSSVGAGTATTGAWQYDEDTGRIKAVIDAGITAAKATDMGLTSADCVFLGEAPDDDE